MDVVFVNIFFLFNSNSWLRIFLYLLEELSLKIFFNRLDRNTVGRVISLFEMPIKKIINFARLFYSTVVLRKSSF